MMGLRWALLSDQEQKKLHDGSLDWVWPAAEKESLPVAMLGGLFLDTFRDIAERHPNLKLILDHCGLNRHGQDEAAFIHLDKLVALASLPNVAIKATVRRTIRPRAIPSGTFRTDCTASSTPLARSVSSGAPNITRMQCSYRQCVTFFTEELPWLKGRDLEDVMGRAVSRDWIDWKAGVRLTP